ncbi:MAG: hypothetical protein IKJ09_06820 [Bacteroidaceae bacterium]|nr:hypothetical protein [Bacteroidaceae bacterium]MBR3984351.1 hypothetical protein [Bacteroidaceae bacterium]MBR4042000.1 hypothetical protein [Bacteroidaceae bacterium]
MTKENIQNGTTPSEPIQQQAPQRKKFQGFSMGFLLIVLAVLVAIYIVCTIIAG